jgi:Tfp pilus assembly protein PilE
MPDTSYSSGTSLLETCIAITIVGVLTTVAVPPILQAHQTYGLYAAASQVRTELHRARILAIVRNQDCRLRVTSSVTYLLECQTPRWVTIAFHQMATGFTITANNRPEFHPMGNVGPMATISVWNKNGLRKRIITSRSGRVRTE